MKLAVKKQGNAHCIYLAECQSWLNSKMCFIWHDLNWESSSSLIKKDTPPKVERK